VISILITGVFFCSIFHFFIDFDLGLTPGVFFGDLFFAADFLAEGFADLL
jgi:hypothetical protein